ncbi:MAG TPA: multicopper oxidase domain-containing protein, partial [Gemmatimonadaceae bacterium]|nr:multicopper oxidase domain-containing protein [Gemmatimonadaceae bacterium]
MKSRALGAVLLLSLASPPALRAQVRERVRANDNRARAGVLLNGTLALRMEARLAEWHPQGDDQPGSVVPAFAEIGRQASIPGPLIRVPAGTEVVTVVRNAVPNTILTIHGLHSRPVVGAAFNDSTQLTYGQIQTLRFKLDRPGTYYYWATTRGSSFQDRTHDDAQLSGAIVVDEAGQRVQKDRILMIGGWTDTVGTENNRHSRRQLFVLNGRSWPQTDRLQYERGDTVRWRVINASADLHPMHLHGFYFRVRRRGDGKADTVVSQRGDLVNTERMEPGSTAFMQWTADRMGNWLFHCHIPLHIEARGPMGLPLPPALTQAGRVHAPGNTGMGGLVAGVEVKQAEEDTTSVSALPPVTVPAARRMRLLLRPNVGSTPLRPYYGVAIDELGAEPVADSGQRVAPPLVLTRNQPVSIMVINRLPEATSIHWHGLELDSYYDGVPGFSGIRPQQAPLIAPNDSFEVRLTPPRAGTFIYHAHVNEVRQLRAGISGALLVVEKGKFDATKEFPVVVSSPSDSVEEERAVLLNGSLTPAPLVLKRAVASRLRLINITSQRQGMRFELRQADTLMTWRPLAKDGADLPVAERTLKPARQPLT